MFFIPIRLLKRNLDFANTLKIEILEAFQFYGKNCNLVLINFLVYPVTFRKPHRNKIKNYNSIINRNYTEL